MRYVIILILAFLSQAFAASDVTNTDTKAANNLLVSPVRAVVNDKAKNPPKKISRVIYITLDGVRWQDIFINRQYLQTFWRKYAKEMKVYGDPKTSLSIEVASVPISLPSYQSQMSGAVQPCQDNFCGRIQVETFPEYLVNKLGFKKKDVAVFASWYEISYAVEKQTGTVYDNSGNKCVYGPETGIADQTMYFFNEESKKYYGDPLDRLDIFTFAHAMHYLETYRPRFLWLSLTDADLAAHLKSKPLYHSVLKLYDRMLDIFFSTLDMLNLSDETMVIITTDHGRGNGTHWTDHGPEYPESKQTFAFVKNGELIPIGDNNHFSTLSIRPTIEGIFKTG